MMEFFYWWFFVVPTVGAVIYIAIAVIGVIISEMFPNLKK